ISIASCLLTIVSIEAAFETHNGESFIRADPMRLAAQIISGVGFLGAGGILKRSNHALSGLKRSSIDLAASGFGIHIEAGYFYEVGIAVVLVSISVIILPFIIQKIGPHALREQEVRLHVYVNDMSNLTQVAQEVRDLVIDVKDIKLKSHNDGHKIEARCTINQGAEQLFINYNKIQKISGVIKADIDSI